MCEAQLNHAYYNLKQWMHTIWFKSQHYNTPAPTGFWNHWPIIKECTITQIVA